MLFTALDARQQESGRHSDAVMARGPSHSGPGDR